MIPVIEVEMISQKNEILKFWLRVLQFESELSSFASTNTSNRPAILAESKHKGGFIHDQTVADAQSIPEKLGRNQIRGCQLYILPNLQRHKPTDIFYIDIHQLLNYKYSKIFKYILRRQEEDIGLGSSELHFPTCL